MSGGVLRDPWPARKATRHTPALSTRTPAKSQRGGREGEEELSRGSQGRALVPCYPHPAPAHTSTTSPPLSSSSASSPLGGLLPANSTDNGAGFRTCAQAPHLLRRPRRLQQATPRSSVRLPIKWDMCCNAKLEGTLACTPLARRCSTSHAPYPSLRGCMSCPEVTNQAQHPCSRALQLSVLLYWYPRAAGEAPLQT